MCNLLFHIKCLWVKFVLDVILNCYYFLYYYIIIAYIQYDKKGRLLWLLKNNHKEIQVTS